MKHEKCSNVLHTHLRGGDYTRCVECVCTWKEGWAEMFTHTDQPIVRQARYLSDKNGVATDIPNPDYVAVER